MKALVGYKLIDAKGDVVPGKQWGGIWGQIAGLPNPLHLPSGTTQVHCPELGIEYEDSDGSIYHLEEWMMDEPAPSFPLLEPWQFWAILEINKITQQQLLDAIASVTDENDGAMFKAIAKNKLLNPSGGKFHRDDPLFSNPFLMMALELTEQEIDALWMGAAALV